MIAALAVLLLLWGAYCVRWIAEPRARCPSLAHDDPHLELERNRGRDRLDVIRGVSGFLFLSACCFGLMSLAADRLFSGGWGSDVGALMLAGSIGIAAWLMFRLEASGRR
jgi:hypothetical protein